MVSLSTRRDAAVMRNDSRDSAGQPAAIGAPLRARAGYLHGTPPGPAGGGPVVERPAAPRAGAALEACPRAGGGRLGDRHGDGADHPAEGIMVGAGQAHATART